MDKQEVELTIRKYKASLELLKYLEPKLKKKFNDFVGDRVWNPDSIIYKTIFPQCREEKKTSSLRRKLSLLVHPDKFKDSDSKDLFCLLEKLSDKDVEDILKNDDPISALREYKNSELISLKKEVHCMESSSWYVYHLMPWYFKDAFCEKKDIEEKVRKLQEENAKLLRENEKLRREIN